MQVFLERDGHDADRRVLVVSDGDDALISLRIVDLDLFVLRDFVILVKSVGLEIALRTLGHPDYPHIVGDS